MKKPSPHIDDLRNILMDTLKDLRDRDNPMELDRARTVRDVAVALVDTARVENEYLKITNGDRSEFIGRPEDDELPNGITGIVRHRLAG